MRSAVALLGALALVLAVVAGAVAWMLGSERGTAWVVSSALERAAGVVTAERVGGTLLRGLTLGGVTLRAGADVVGVEDVEIDLAPGALLRGVLLVERVETSSISYVRGVSPAEAGARARTDEGVDALPRLPLAIEIRRAFIAGLDLETAQDRLQFDALTFAASYADGELQLEELTTASNGVALHGRAQLRAEGALQLSAEIDWRHERGGDAYTGRLTLAGRLPELDVHHELTAPFAVTAAGTIWVENTPRVALHVEWDALEIPGGANFGSLRGSADLRGPTTALEITTAGAVEAVGRTFEYEAAGTLNGAVLELEAAAVEGPGGRVEATGEIVLDALEWTATLRAAGLDPAAYDARWPGRIDAFAEISGGFRPQLRIEARTARLAGELRGIPFEATAAGAFEPPNAWRIDMLELVREEDRVRLSGAVGERVELTIDANVARLDRWWPNAEGRLVADVRAAGTQAKPELEGSVSGRALAWGGYTVEAVDVRGRIGAHADGTVELSVAADGVGGRRIDVRSVRAEIRGSSGDQRISVAADAAQWRAELAGRGGLARGIWRGSLDSARVSQERLGEWQLTVPSAVELGRGRAVLAPTCLAQSGTSLCGTLRILGREDDEIALSASNFDVQALQPFMPSGLEIRGVYQVSAAVTDLRGDPRGYAAVAGGATDVRVELSEQQVVDAAISSAALHATLERGRLALNFALDGGDDGGITLEAAVADVRSESSPVDGRLEIDWRNLEPLALLSPDVASIEGDVGVQVDFGGTLTAPEMGGTAQWNGGAVEVPAWGLRVEQIRSTAVTVDGTTLEYEGTGLIDGRELRVVGRTELDPQRDWPTRFSVSGDDVQVVQRADAEVFVSPRLEVEVAIPSITVQGTIDVPRAVIAVEELPAQAVRPSGDGIVHGVSAPEPVRPLRMSADVRVVLGDDVHYNGLNLTTDVSGELDLAYRSGRSPAAEGVVMLDGTYDAYGQSLELERGELRFTGPLDDPAIDVRAQRRVGETTAGVQLTGTLKSPITRIYSDPAMSEADALAYLLLGRPLSGSGEQETATLETAALAMGLQQALPVVQRIGATLGLDEFSIETTDADAGSLMAGKYLSPRLYVRYSYGLFNRIGGLLVRFRFNERLSLETRSGEEKSMDLLYTVEKN